MALVEIEVNSSRIVNRSRIVVNRSYQCARKACS